MFSIQSFFHAWWTCESQARKQGYYWSSFLLLVTLASWFTQMSPTGAQMYCTAKQWPRQVHLTKSLKSALLTIWNAMCGASLGSQIMSKDKVICKICRTKLVYYDAMTSNLRAHLSTLHPGKLEDCVATAFSVIFCSLHLLFDTEYLVCSIIILTHTLILSLLYT